MPTTRPGSRVPGVSDSARNSWYAFRHFNAGSSQDPKLSYLAGYQRGVADMMVDQFRLGGWDDMTRRMLEAFEYLSDQRAAVQMVGEEVSQ